MKALKRFALAFFFALCAFLPIASAAGPGPIRTVVLQVLRDLGITSASGVYTPTTDAGQLTSGKLPVARGGTSTATPLLAYSLGKTLYPATTSVTVGGLEPIALCFDGTFVWVSNNNGTVVSKINAATNAVVANITVGNSPYGICYDGAFVWVANAGDNTVSKINATTNAVVATVSVGLNSGSTPFGMCYDGSSVWITNVVDGSVQRINTATNTVTATIFTGKQSYNLCFDGSYLWVANSGFTDNAVTKLATAQTGAIDLSAVSDGQFLMGSSARNSMSLGTITGTANQVISTVGSASITLSTPQNINTTSSPTFAALTLTAALTEANGGTHQSTYATGDTLYASAANTLSKLTGNITATKNFLGQTGNGSASAAPTWAVLAAGDIPSLAASKINSGTLAVAQGGTNLGSYAVGDILFASGTGTIGKLADVATGQVLVSGGANTAPGYSASPSLSSLTLTSGLTLTGATITGTPTWSSNQAITLSTGSQPNVTSLGTVAGLTMTGTLSMSGTPVISGSPASTLGATTVTTLGTGGNVTLATGNNLVLATSGAGTQIGTGTTQLLGFYGATAVAQIAGSTDVLAGLVTQGLRAASSNPALNLGSGTVTGGGFVNAAAGTYSWTGRSVAASPADGQIAFKNSAATGFTSLLYGANASGSDTASTSNTTILVGASTGIGAPPTYRVQTPFMAAVSGSTVQVQADRDVIGNEKVLSASSATATTYAIVTLPTGSSCGGEAWVCVEAADNVNGANDNRDMACARIQFGGTNKNGTVTLGTSQVSTETSQGSSGSTTATPTAVASGATILLKVTPTFTTIVPTTSNVRVRWRVFLNGPGTVAAQ